MPYESKLIAMIPNMVLVAPMYAFLTQLLDTSNYRVVSAEIITDIVISIKSYAYRIYTVRFVGASFARDRRSRFGDRSYNPLDASLRKS